MTSTINTMPSTLNKHNNLRTLSTRKAAIAQHFSRANHYNKHANIQQKTCQILVENIASLNHSSVLEVGAGTGQLTRLLAQCITSKHWLINELCEKQAEVLQAILPTATLAIGDAETMDLSYTYDEKHSLIMSANTIQWFDNPLSFIKQSYSRLASGGQLLCNTFTPANFKQIKTLTKQGLTYPTTNQWQAALEQSGFIDTRVSTHSYDVLFASPYEVLRHMKLTGVSTNHTDTAKQDSSFTWTKTRLKQFESDYWQQFSTTTEQGEKCVILTYDVLMINAVKP